MANNKDFVVKGLVEINGTAKQKTGTVSSSSSTVTVDNISQAVADNLEVAGMSGTGGIAFNADGTYLYYTRTTEIVYQYALSTAWDTTTIAGTATATLDVSGTLGDLRSLSFNSDGTKMYLQDLTADTLYQYSLTTAYDITTASYDSKSYNYGTQTPYSLSHSLHNNDTTLIIVDQSNHTVDQYTLSTAGDISTASYTGTTSAITATMQSPTGCVFNSDGTKLYVAATDPTNGTYAIFEFSLSTAYTVSTASYVAKTGPLPTTCPGLTMKPDDSYLYTVYGARFSFDISKTTFDVDLSTGTIFTPTLALNSIITLSNPPSTGTQNFKLNLDTTANTSFDLSNTPNIAKVADGVSSINSIYVKDKSRFYGLNHSSTAFLYTWDMVDFDVTTHTSGGTAINMSDSGDYAYAGGLFFKPDGTKVFIMGSGYKRLSEFSLSIPWDISSHTFTTWVTYSPSGANPPSGLFFKPDGTRVYINYANSVYQFDLGTAWSIIGGTANGSFTFSGNKYGLTFNDDGTKMVVSESAGVKRLEEYTLSTAWDVSTASLTTTLDGPYGLSLSSADNNTRLFTVYSSKVYEYQFGGSVSTTWPSSFNWNNGSEPELTGQSASIKLVTPDGGTTYLAK